MTTTFLAMAAALCACATSRPAATFDARAYVDRYYATFQAPGYFVDELLAWYTDDVVFTDPTFEITARGKAQVRRLYADLGTERTSYANIAWDIRNVVAQGDRVVINGRWSGRFYHCDFDIEFMTLWRLRDGRIAEQSDFFAAAAFDRQVGWDAAQGIATCPRR